MQLKSFGDSFIFGSDLPGAIIAPRQITPSSYTWPALLAKYLGYDYKSLAYPGVGNLQILEQILNSDPADLFVINWTWIDRFDHNNGTTDRFWSTIMPGDNTELAKIYYRDLHSEYRDKFTSLTCIKLAIDTLEQQGTQFIMTYMDELLFDQRWHTSPAIIKLQEYVKPHMTTFEGKTFLDWSRANGYLISERWHPLEEAHRAAGDYIIRVFDKQNTINL
jgi:hypothetical protein